MGVNDAQREEAESALFLSVRGGQVERATAEETSDRIVNKSGIL